MIDYIKSATLLFALLNPFLVIIYLVDLVKTLERKQFTQILIQAGIIASIVLCIFAILGDFIFSGIVQAEFASFQIFGGIIFLLIGLQFVFRGTAAIDILKGESKYVAGAIAMPVLIGPGTISASVIIGKRHDQLSSITIVLLVMLISVLIMLALKALHDFVRPRSEPIVDKYIEITGRIAALYVGTIAIEMIMQGIRTWAVKF
jgi:multiple antibiotic resistance protein